MAVLGPRRCPIGFPEAVGCILTHSWPKPTHEDPIRSPFYIFSRCVTSNPGPKFDFLHSWGQDLRRFLTFLTFEVKASAEFWLFWLLRSRPSAENRLVDFWVQDLSRTSTWLLRSRPQPKSTFLLLRSRPLPNVYFFLHSRSRPQPKIDFLMFYVKPSAEFSPFWLSRST